MASNWPEARIEEIAETVAMGPFGSNIKVETFVDSGIPIISGQHLKGWRLDDAPGHRFISEEHADRLSKANVKRGDIVFTHAGNIGQVAVVPENSRYERYVLSQRQFFLRCKRHLVDPDYLVAFFHSRAGRHALLANASQVGVPSLARPVTYLRQLKVPLPPLEEQRRIAHILGTLDNKIELNRYMNETLEEMARALFKSWFVDFDPVRAKAEGRDPGIPKHLADLFPDHLVDSELGEIPEGWKCTALGEIVREHRNGVNPLETPDDLFDHFSIPAFDAGRVPVRESGSAIRSLKYTVPKGAVLLSKLNPETGRVWAPDLHGGVRPVCSTEFVVLIPNPPVGRAWLQCLLSSAGIRETLSGLVTGTSKSHQRVQKSALFTIPVALPGRSLLDGFAQYAGNWLGRAEASRQEVGVLAASRDHLLGGLLGPEPLGDPGSVIERAH